MPCPEPWDGRCDGAPEQVLHLSNRDAERRRRQSAAVRQLCARKVSPSAFAASVMRHWSERRPQRKYCALSVRHQVSLSQYFRLCWQTPYASAKPRPEIFIVGRTARSDWLRRTTLLLDSLIS